MPVLKRALLFPLLPVSGLLLLAASYAPDVHSVRLSRRVQDLTVRLSQSLLDVPPAPHLP